MSQMKAVRRRTRFTGFCSALVLTSSVLLSTGGTSRASQSAPSAGPDVYRFFTKPVLVKNSPTNLKYFDVSWEDNVTRRYYLADRSNNAIDVVDSATDTFIGFIGKGQYTGAVACPGQPEEMRLCAGPNGVITDDLHHVWAGDGNGNIIEAGDKPAAAIIRSIPTGGTGRIDEFAYDPVDQVVLAENDGNFPPYLTFIAATSGRLLGFYIYPKDQDGMEQPVWDPETRLFYENVPGRQNRIDVFDPRKLPRPVKSIPVSCSGGLLGLTVSGLTVGPKGVLMTVCGSRGGAEIDPVTGKVLGIVPQGADADEVWYDSGTNNYYFSGNEALNVVNASTLQFITSISLPSHSVAVDARNHHVFVPVAGKGIFVVTMKR